MAGIYSDCSTHEIIIGAYWRRGYYRHSGLVVVCTQGVDDFELAAFRDGGVNITGLRLVDVLNKTVRDFLLERQSRRRLNSLGDDPRRTITVSSSSSSSFPACTTRCAYSAGARV